ncbi:MAG: CRISPR-associated helicase Cas3' [Spirochaetales bacterium]|nr:CRISPR-associated helicase Cas3' [Spirochaetales bacterium]
MSLSNIDTSCFSHPDYYYRDHINNIADSFNDRVHRNAAEYHDLGKLSTAFQNYIRSVNNSEKTTHTLESALIFLKENSYTLNKETLPVFISILKHHGNLENVNDLASRLNYPTEILEKHKNFLIKIGEIQNVAGLINTFNLDSCCDYFYEEPFVEYYKFSGIDMYYKIKEVFSRLIFSDKYEAIFKKSYEAVPFTGFDIYIERLNHLISEKKNNLTLIRNEARINAITKLKENINKKIFLVEAPTGIGKTFMALQLSLELGKIKQKNRIINALPMTSIIDQAFEEYSKIIDSSILMKFHHLSYTKEYVNNDAETNEEINYSKQKNVFINKSWSEDHVIVTTFNQILNLFYSNKNSDLIKFWTLRNSVIIFDEIQAIPRVLLKDFSETINFLSKEFNINFILMSATVPDIKKYLDEKVFCELLENKYYSMEFNNRYALKMDRSIDCIEKLIEEIENEFKKYKSVLCVVNTKKLASTIYQELIKIVNEKEIVFLLSSLFIPKHRKEIIDEMKTALKSNKKIILVSTQVIEAGVDLDFDTGFREFAPLYSIIQTAGRVNREDRKGVKESARLVIFPKLAYSPYHSTDLLQDIVFDLLKDEIRENNLLPLLKNYFEIAIKRTSPDVILLEQVENLEFENVVKLFNANFMKEIPGFIPVFIEIEEHLYNKFVNQLKERFILLSEKTISLEAKLNIKAQIKDIYKGISAYVINVPIKEAVDLPYFYKDDEVKVCGFDLLISHYSDKMGWHTLDKFIF